MPVTGFQLGIVDAISVLDDINMAAFGLQLIAKGLSPIFEGQIIDEVAVLSFRPLILTTFCQLCNSWQPQQ